MPEDRLPPEGWIRLKLGQGVRMDVNKPGLQVVVEAEGLAPVGASIVPPWDLEEREDGSLVLFRNGERQVAVFSADAKDDALYVLEQLWDSALREMKLRRSQG
jgi:hypothetical protein